MNPRDFVLSRSGSIRRTREGYWAYWPEPLPPQLEWSPALLSHLSAADRSLGELTATLRLSPNLDLWLPLLNAREACLSCRIDGHAVDLQEFIQSQLIPGSRLPSPEALQPARNYTAALNLSSGQERTDFSLGLLEKIHAALLPETLGDPGLIRSDQNWIGPLESSPESATFVPPPPDRLERGLETLTAFVNHDTSLPPLIKLGLIHYQFEALHPFMSGNGRLGRFLCSSLPVLWGDLPVAVLHPSGYLLTHREAYFELLLAVSQRSAWNEWLSFFLQTITASTQLSIQILSDLEAFMAYKRKVLSTFRTGPRLQRLLDFVSKRPIFTVRQVESDLGVNFAVAQRYVNQFEGLKIVEEITGQARNRIYRAPGILDILTDTM